MQAIIMDIHSNLEYLCRVCAANTKGKNSVAECVYILKTAGLKDKLDKFLYLKVSENDSLPKVLCKSCFRQVEATASLSKIAKHTQQVFRDFLLSNLPKGPSESRSTAEFTSSDFMGTKSTSDNAVAAAAPMVQLAPPPPPPPVSTPILPPPVVQPTISTSRKDDVVVNVSVADPLTRDNQQKMISNSQRRQSLLLDSRFTPKSIAQKQIPTTMKAPRPIAPKLAQSAEVINVINNPKPTAPLINFYPVKPQQQAQLQQTPQVTQITTFSSGGYVIGRIDSANSSTKEEPKKSVQNTPENILQEKRKNLVKALNNIKANNTGQVSLLKSSQQKQAEALQNVAKTPLAEVVNQAAEDELPDRIIIAAPKNKLTAEKSKKEPLNLSSKIPATIAKLPIPASSSASAATALQQQQQQDQINSLNGSNPKPGFPEDITLGRVIRDMDLLKLILKALKWPVNKQNIELQLQRLRNSKFTDIMSDSNLLQDTDLTQLLGPYLAPVLLAAQALQQQQQQILANTAILNNQSTTATLTKTQPQMTALEAAQEEINKSIPYKLPPETSVQLVPATPEETEANHSPPLPAVNNAISASVSIKRDKKKYTKSAAVAATQKKQRRSAAQRARDSIVISDEEEGLTEGVAPKKARQRGNRSFATQLELDPNFITHFNLLSGSGGNEADELMALLLKQKAALLKDQKVQKRRRNSVSNVISLPPSEFDALIDLDDDIVLMEPVSTTSSETGTSTPEQQQPARTDLTNTFVMPSVPLITRPIIKRRKTVIHSLKDRINFTTEIRNMEPPSTSSISLLRAKEKHMEETINQVAAGNITVLDNQIQSSTNKNLMPEKSVVSAPVELAPVTKAPQQKKTQSKSSLGKQLLEAIGLQQLPPKIVSNIQNETPSSSTASTDAAAAPKSKQSIQRIRSALKKSLKQAQEQQQKKIELSSSASNTIIQDADSTTKPAVKEILVVEGKANKSDVGSSEVDVEEQIDKVTLMVRKNDEEAGDHSPEKTNEKEEKIEAKKSSSKRLQDRRSTITNRAAMEKEKTHEVQWRSEKVTEETEKLTKETSSLASNEAPAPNSQETVAPKRRGRKRLVDKQAELDAAEAKEKENDDTPLSLLIEKSQPLEKLEEEESEMANSNKNEEESESNKTPGRPTRQSKTQSRYYKGPDKPAQSKRLLPSRTTRNRKYC